MTNIVPDCDFDEAVEQIRKEHQLSMNQEIALRKIIARRQLQDNDACNIQIGGMFVLTWRLCKRLGEEKAFLETLEEISNHCLQGDSHRLFVLYYALTVSQFDI